MPYQQQNLPISKKLKSNSGNSIINKMPSKPQPSIQYTLYGTNNIVYEWCVDKDMRPSVVPQLVGDPEEKPRGRMGRSWWCSTGYDNRENCWKECARVDARLEEKIQKHIKSKEGKRWLRQDTKYINECEKRKYWGHQIDYWYNYQKTRKACRGIVPTYKYAPCRPYDTIRNRYGGIDGFILHRCDWVDEWEE